MYLWLKAFHIIFMVTWFAGLFYLPRLFVYHAMSDDEISIARFKVMERKLYYGIATTGGVLTVIFGVWMAAWNGMTWVQTSPWLLLKLTMVGLLIIYHIYLGYLVSAFKRDANRHSHVYFRWLNELPVVLLAAIVILAIVKPWA